MLVNRPISPIAGFGKYEISIESFNPTEDDDVFCAALAEARLIWKLGLEVRHRENH